MGFLHFLVNNSDIIDSPGILPSRISLPLAMRPQMRLRRPGSRAEIIATVSAEAEQAARDAARTRTGSNSELDDIDGPLLFLCSDTSRHVAGQVIMVDKGSTAK